MLRQTRTLLGSKLRVSSGKVPSPHLRRHRTACSSALPSYHHQTSRRFLTNDITAHTMASAPPTRFKLVFYVPKENLEECKNAIFKVGAGTFPGGKYEQCSFESSGTGQFLPVAEKGANPTIGEKKTDGSGEYRVERVEEIRCEIMCVGRDLAQKAVDALKKAHPYEEPAYEVYRMEDL